jgi:hypothetical protein
VPAGPSSSRLTGSPPFVSPAGRTRPGSPAVLSGSMFREMAAWNGTLFPPISTVSVAPIGAAGIRVAGKMIAARLFAVNYSRNVSLRRGR